MNNIARMVIGGVLLSLFMLASGCVVEPQEGYHDHYHHRWYHEHHWRECHEHEEHCY